MNEKEPQTRGIPHANFVEDVERFVDGRNVDEVLRSLDERYDDLRKDISFLFALIFITDLKS